MSGFMLSPLSGRLLGGGALRSSSSSRVPLQRSSIAELPVRTRAVAEDLVDAAAEQAPGVTFSTPFSFSDLVDAVTDKVQSVVEQVPEVNVTSPISLSDLVDAATEQYDAVAERLKASEATLSSLSEMVDAATEQYEAVTEQIQAVAEQVQAPEAATQVPTPELPIPILPTVGDEVSPYTPPVPDIPQTTYNLSKKLSISDYPGLAPKPSVPAPESQLPDLPDLSAANEALANAAADAQAAASQLAGNVTGAFAGLAGSLTGGVSGVTGSVTSGLSGVSDTVSSSLSGVTGSVTNSLSGLTGKASEASRLLGSSVSSTTAGVSERVDETTQVARQTLGAALSAVTGAVDGVNAALGGSITAAGQSVGLASEQLLSSLPPEGRQALEVAAQGAAAAATAAAAHPTEASVVAGLVAVPLVASWYQDRFAGYGGELDGEQVRSLLVSDKQVVLVDIREDEERAAAGVPELRLGARYKAASLPLSLADPLTSAAVLRQVGNRDQLRLAVGASLIAGLKQVKSSLDMVVIMSSRGDKQAKELARALRKEGVFQAYVLKGGFAGWVKSGLPVEEASDYAANPALVLKDEIDVVSRKASELFGQASKPNVAVPLLAASGVAVLAAVNYHVTLQVLGLWGTAFSVYNGSALAFFKGAASGAATAAASASSAASQAAAKQQASKQAAAAKAAAAAKLAAAKQADAIKPAVKEPVPAAERAESAAAAEQPRKEEQGVKEPQEQLSS